jgi:molybdenum cofactor cytidylyltransferase
MAGKKSMCKIGAVILAAGKSTRMGKPKLLLPYKGKPLFMHPLQLALQHQLHPIVCITGCYHEQMRHLLSPLEKDVAVVFNSSFESGMASSLKIGIQSMPKQVDAALIFLGDQPLIPEKVVQRIMKEFKKSKREGIKIIRPLFGKRLGHPILFEKSLFREFDGLEGDEGGKSIINRHKEALKLLHFEREEWGIDIDTEEEYRILIEKD